MTQRWTRAIDLLFWLAAVAWPLDLLQYVPGLGLTLLSLIAVMILPLLVLDATAQNKLRVPFEFLAPALIVLALTGADAAIHGPSDTFGEIVAAVILLVAVTHFAPSRNAIRRYLFATVITGFGVTLWTLFSRLLHVTPTAFSARSGVTFTFAYSVPSGVLVLLLLLCIAVYIARERRYPPPARAVATGAIVFLACALVGAAVFWALDEKMPPVMPYPMLDVLQIAEILVALWLVARILGKVAIDARILFDPIHSLWFLTSTVTLFVCACAPVPPAGYHGLLAGYACASVLPSRLDIRAARTMMVLAAVPVALAVMNLIVVFPGNVRDQRQYDAASRRDFESGDYRRLLARLDTIESHAPAERRTHLWRARTALALGLPNWASFEFLDATAPIGGRLLLPPPSHAERKDFVVQLRDLVAIMPEERSVCAFERTLLTEGDRDAALYSLRLETAVPLTHVDVADPTPFAEAIAFIVGDASIAGELRFWSPDELITLLTYWGAVPEEPEPDDAGRTSIIVGQRTVKGFNLFAHIDGRVEILRVDLASPAPDDVAALADAGLLRWSKHRVVDLDTRYVLIVDTAEGEQEVGHLTFDATGSMKFERADPEAVVPFTPAIYLRTGP